VETGVDGIGRLRVRLIGYTRSSDAREQEESHASQEKPSGPGREPTATASSG